MSENQLGKVKLRQIVDAMPAVGVFANTLAEEPKEKDKERRERWLQATAKERYSIGKLVRKMNEENTAYQESRTAAVKKFGAPKTLKRGEEEIETTVVKPEHDKAFKDEMDKLLDEEVDLSVCVKIPWSYVLKVNPVPSVIADLIPFMEEPPEGE